MVGATSFKPTVSFHENTHMYSFNNVTLVESALASAGEYGTPALTDCYDSDTFVPVQYTLKSHTVVKPDKDGMVWLLLGTDSQFGGVTTIYFQHLNVTFVPV